MHKRQLRVDYIEARVLEIALRAYVHPTTTISDEDKKFMGDHLGTISQLWSQTSVMRSTLYAAELENGNISPRGWENRTIPDRTH